jgi:hypothetical protein
MMVLKEKHIVAAGLLSAGIVFSIIALRTVVIEGGADNYAHYNISRWIFRHPDLIFDLWGKPVFTILCAPFAQFGFIGVRFFNIVCGLLTAWFGYKITVSFKLRYAWLTTLVIVSAPIYLVMLTSGMTEILFSLILIISVYLFFDGRYNLSSVFLSFLFLIRIEGLAFELLFLIAFIIKRRYQAIPFLATGFLFFSILGSVFLYNDFFWLIHNRPYARGGVSVYGSGSIWHYLLTMPSYFGYFIMLFLLIGTAFLFYQWKRVKFSLSSEPFLIILLIAGCLYGYIAIHSFLWWKGETSVGLLRVMAAVSPLAGIIAVTGFNESLNFLKKKPLVRIAVASFCILPVLIGIRYYDRMLRQVDLSAEVLTEVTTWLKKSGSVNHKMVVHDPYFAYSTGVDPWNTNFIQFGFSSNEFPESGLPDSSIFVWDAHFSSNEGRMPLEKIMANKNFQLVKKFEPKYPFTVLGGYYYKIIVFMKTNPSLMTSNKETAVKEADMPEKKLTFKTGFDFETPTGDTNIDSRVEPAGKNHTSKFYRLTGDLEFGPGFVLTDKQLKITPGQLFNVAADILSEKTLELRQFLLVFSIEKDNKSIFYATFDFAENSPEPGKWVHSEHVFKVPESIEKGSSVKIYIWNINKKQLFIDNFYSEVSESEL